MTQDFQAEELGLRSISSQNVSVSVPQSGNTVLMELFTTGISKVSVQVTNAVQDLDAFIIEGRVHVNGTWRTLASAAGDFSTPSGRVSNVSGAPVTLAAAATAYFDLDVSGLAGVRFSASGGNATASTVSIYASGGPGMAPQPPANGTALAPSSQVVTTQPPAVTEVRSTALETSHVLKASAGQLRQLSVFNSKGSAQFILLLNSATLSADGAVTLLYPPIPIAAGAIVVIDWPAPLVASTGITVCNSSTGSFTKTIGSADCAFYAQVN